MPGVRRPPKAPSKPRPKVKAPIHHRILGRSQVETDTLDDLERELEKAYELDLVEYDVYLDCWEALQVRREKANIGLAKATGKYVKPKVDIPVRRVRQSPPKALTVFQKKLIFVVCFLIFIKIFC